MKKFNIKMINWKMICLILLVIFISGCVNEVKYDQGIFEEFNKTKWVRVDVNLKDNSGINIAGTKEEKIESLRKRDEWFKSVIDEVLSTLSEDEFKLIRRSSDGFDGSLTIEGFSKLINDDRIKAIYPEVIMTGALENGA